MKQKKSGAAMGALLMGLLLCTAGCATETSASVTETEEQSSMELPPLVTTALAEETDVSATETQLSTEIKQVPLFSGEISDWELPAERCNPSGFLTASSICWVCSSRRADRGAACCSVHRHRQNRSFRCCIRMQILPVSAA